MIEKNNNSQTLYKALWNSADILRSKMDANDYKSYLLGLIFYKYLSDQMLLYIDDLLEEEHSDLKGAQKAYVNAMNDIDLKSDLVETLKDELNYIIEPELTFTNLIMLSNRNAFQIELLAQGFRNIEQSNELFENLFEDIDLYSKKLGSTFQKQNDTISLVMRELDSLDLVNREGETLGDAYEYLIGQFASDSGKKAGEFYTPQPIAKLMTQIVLYGKEDKRGFTLYDAAMGSGSLLLNAKKYSNEASTLAYYGQELNTSTYNLARMNMILHGVAVENQILNNADTLDQDWPIDEPTNFDAVLMNPPYSAKWSASSGFLQDPRFSSYEVLAPKSKADFAFLLHGYYHLKQNGGVMAIVLPHGVLFRGGNEAKIRKHLLEEGAVDTIIGIPSNIFFNTNIPTTIIILKKDRTNRSVLFIDASKQFIKEKNKNTMNNEHINKILETYIKRKDTPNFSSLASYEEIKKNDFNLNISRYVDTFEEEEISQLSEIAVELSHIDENIKKTTKEFYSVLDELIGTTPEEDKELKEFVKTLKKGLLN